MLYPLFSEVVICGPGREDTEITLRYQSPRDAHLAHAALIAIGDQVALVGQPVDTESEAREKMADSFAADFAAVGEGEGNPNASTADLDAAFAKGLGDNGAIAADQATWGRDPLRSYPAEHFTMLDPRSPVEPENSVVAIARAFIDKHHISCAEATSDDGVYEEAPLLVEKLAKVVGYYRYPETDI